MRFDKTHPKEETVDKDTWELDMMQREPVFQLTPE